MAGLQFSTSVEAFLKAVKTVLPVVGGRTFLPNLTHVHIESDLVSEVIRLRTTNLDWTMVVSCPAAITAAGACCLPAKRLADLLALLPGDAQASVTVTPPATAVLTVADGGTYRLTGSDPEDFPEMPVLTTPPMVLEGEAVSTLATMLETTAFAAAREAMTRPVLSGVYWDVEEAGRVCVVACDGHMLAAAETEAFSATNLPTCIIPGAMVKPMLALLCSVTSVTWQVDEHRLMLTAGATILVTSLVEGPYVAWRGVLPTDDRVRTIMTVEREALGVVLRRMRTISPSQTRLVRWDIGESTSWLMTKNAEDGATGDETVAIGDVTGVPLQVAFNAEYALAIVHRCPMTQMRWRFTTPDGPMLIEPAEANGDVRHRFLLMPLRLDRAEVWPSRRETEDEDADDADEGEDVPDEEEVGEEVVA
jgi:DNA polymerase-3 subunit beta